MNVFFIMCFYGYFSLSRGEVIPVITKMCEETIELNCTDDRQIHILTGSISRSNYACTRLVQFKEITNTTITKMKNSCGSENRCRLNISDITENEVTEQSYVNVEVNYKCNKKDKTITKHANEQFNLNCYPGKKITIKNIIIKQQIGKCRACGDINYCSNLDAALNKCNGKRTCKENGRDIFNLSEPCMKLRKYVKVVYNCTEGTAVLPITGNNNLHKTDNSVAHIAGVATGGLCMLCFVLIAAVLIRRKCQINPRKEIDCANILDENPVSRESAQYAYADISSTLQIHDNTKDQASMNTHELKLQNDRSQNICSSIHTAHTPKYVDLVDGKHPDENRQSTGITNYGIQTYIGKNIPMDIGHTESVYSVATAEDSSNEMCFNNNDGVCSTDKDDTYMETCDGLYDTSGNRRHKDIIENIYCHAVDDVYDSANQNVHKTNDKANYDHVALNELFKVVLD